MVEEYAILVSYAPSLSGTPSILAGETFLRSAMKNGGFHPRSVCYGMFRFHFPFVFNEKRGLSPPFRLLWHVSFSLSLCFQPQPNPRDSFRPLAYCKM